MNEKMEAELLLIGKIISQKLGLFIFDEIDKLFPGNNVSEEKTCCLLMTMIIYVSGIAAGFGDVEESKRVIDLISKGAKEMIEQNKKIIEANGR